MVVINLFGGPGSGKSTTAAGLFFKMKLDNRVKSVELVTEFAKDLVYAGRTEELRDNQLYITAKQHSRMQRLVGKVDYIITDSPLIQSIMYTPEDYFNSFKQLVIEVYSSFTNLNIFINRVKKYEQYGRDRTEEESNIISNNILGLLDENNLNYIIVDGDNDAPDIIKKVLL